MPPYEIVRTVRAAGLDPLAPPLREGTTYVLRATDFRGTLMRVVVDANTGTIRAVNRIVPAPVMSGQITMMPPPYGSPPDDMPPYSAPPEFDASQPPPSGQAGLLPPPFAPRPPTARSGARRNPPPLPRPRPAALASQKSGGDAGPETGPAPSAAAPGANKKSDARSDVTTAAPASPLAPPVKPGKMQPGPPIND